MNDQEIFQNRELSWLAFNERVLEEAEDEHNPLLERLKFIAIFSSNLDEFFMIRVAGLQDLVDAGYNTPDISGLTPAQQLDAIHQQVHLLIQRQYRQWDKLKNELAAKNISFERVSQASPSLQNYLKKRFEKQIFPALTPMAIDPTHPFPFLYNKTLNILCRLQSGGNEEQFAIIPVPNILPRFYRIEWENSHLIFFIEDLIQHFGKSLFPGFNLLESSCFRLIRNADLTVDEEGAEDLLREIQDRLKERKKGAVVRLEAQSSFQKKYLEQFQEILEIGAGEIQLISQEVDLTFAMDLSFELSPLLPRETFPDFSPIYFESGDLFSVLKEQDILLHHPYDSFQTVVDLLKQAAEDPNVLAIKQTLYRNSGENSQVVKQLIRAVENQKQVTVLLELKARFDEEKNILWAQKLEEAGCHVIYGLKGLKTHSKALLIVRKEENGQIRRYMHFGTGNYNEKTAKLYTDISFLTSSENYAVDTSSFFNYLTGYALEPDWNKVSIAPTGIRNKILRLIDEEIQHQKNGREGHVIAKMNSLVDQRTIEKLYEASRNGVKVDLIIRGICCLRAGVKGLSENIRVVSIVGRFLEHSRIFYFRNGGHGKERVYISSADWMPRNFDRRVELMVPIESENAKDKLIRLLTFNLMDNQKSRVLLDSTYVRKERGKKETPFLIHEEMLV